jgi:sterol desaturase/sphingolipid hydroxylase (fatty acid hydroxylase superfamily)
MERLKFNLIAARLQDGWARIVESHHPADIEFVGTLVAHFVSFWLLSLFFLCLDNVRSLHKYKIQPLPKQPYGRALWRCFLCTLGNQVLTSSLHFLQLQAVQLLTSDKSIYRVEASLPSLTETLASLLGCFLLREIIFYHVHRLLHHPLFYTRFHKQHHRFTTPIALASQYSHPVEHVLANIIPIAAPARLFGLHIITFWVFMTCGIAQATIAHCGYETSSLFGWKPGVHDAHHELFSVNYGLFGLLDMVYGTRYVKRKD